MAAIILSGGAYGANWLPLILPLLAIVIIAKGTEMVIHYFRKRRQHHENRIANDLYGPFDEAGGNNHES